MAIRLLINADMKRNGYGTAAAQSRFLAQVLRSQNPYRGRESCQRPFLVTGLLRTGRACAERSRLRDMANKDDETAPGGRRPSSKPAITRSFRSDHRISSPGWAIANYADQHYATDAGALELIVRFRQWNVNSSVVSTNVCSFMRPFRSLSTR